MHAAVPGVLFDSDVVPLVEPFLVAVGYAVAVPGEHRDLDMGQHRLDPRLELSRRVLSICTHKPRTTC